MYVENWKGVTQLQIRTYIFFIKGQNLLAGNQQWGKTHFSHGFFPILLFFLWFPYNYYIGPIFQGGMAPMPVPKRELLYYYYLRINDAS